jgi:hypothetical protein
MAYSTLYAAARRSVSYGTHLARTCSAGLTRADERKQRGTGFLYLVAVIDWTNRAVSAIRTAKDAPCQFPARLGHHLSPIGDGATNIRSNPSFSRTPGPSMSSKLIFRI